MSGPVSVRSFVPANPPFVVYGELSADGRDVVMMAGGDIERAAGHLQKLTPTFGKTDPPGGVQMPVSWPLVVQLGAELGPAWKPGPRLLAWIKAEMARRTLIEPLKAVPAAHAPGEPRSYQIEGAQLIGSTGVSLICDDPGTGKTLTTLLGLLEMRERGLIAEAGRMFVVCPNSVVDNWIREAHAWTNLRAIAWRGEASKRKRLLDTRYDLYVAGYGTVRRDADPHEKYAPLHKFNPTAVVIDECHFIKNPDSLQSRAVRSLGRRAQGIIGLSGTPITHGPSDLWPMLTTMSPAAYPSRERYVTRYIDLVGGDYSAGAELGLNPFREPEFRMTLHGHYRRLAKADVLSHLPPKVYSTRWVTLPPAARKAYDSMESDMIAEMADGTELTAMGVLAQLIRLNQLAAASGDVETWTEMVEDRDGNVEERIRTKVHLREPSWKVDAFMEVRDERRESSVLAFAPSKQLVMLAGARAEKAGYRVGYVVGNQTPTERQKAVDDFQAGKLDTLCLSTGAGGVGLTLTAASTVVFLQRPWSYVEASQAEDRAHRIGSEVHESIEIVDIVAENTIDSRVRDVLRGKSQSLAELLQDPRIAAQCLGGTGA